MAIFGSGINPALGRVDYSPIAQGMATGGQLAAQGLSNFGTGVTQGIQNFLKKQEEKKNELEGIEFIKSQIPGIDDATAKAGLKAAGGPAAYVKFRQDMMMVKQQQDAAARQAEMDNLQISRARDEAAERAARKADLDAMTAAYGSVPKAISSKVMVPEAVYGVPSPVRTVPGAGVMPGASNLPYSEAAKIGLSDFLYSSGANVKTSPIPAPKLPKDLEDFAMRDPNTGNVVGIDRNTLSRWVGDETAKRSAIQAEISQINAQAQQQLSKGISGTFPKSLDTKANKLRSQLEDSFKEQKRLFTKVSEFENQKPSLKSAVESLPPSKLVDRSVKEVEKTVEREASGEEKTAAFLGAYVSKGGRITPDFIEKVKDAFKSEVSVLDVGDGITVVRAGNSAQIIDRNKPLNASQMDRIKAEQYQSMLNQLAAESEWSNLPLELKQAISSAAALHEKNQNMMGARMSGQEAFEARRQELMASGAARSGAAAPAAVKPVAKPMGMPSNWQLVR